MRLGRVVLWGCLVVGSGLIGGVGAREPPARPLLIVAAVEPSEIVGQLTRLTATGEARLSTPHGPREARGVYELRQRDRPVPLFPTGPQVVTAAGERVAGELVGGDGSRLRFRPAAIPTPDDEPWAFPLSAVSAIWLTDLPADTPPDPGRYPWAEGVRNRDLLRYRNGDTARGTVQRLDTAEGTLVVRFRPETGEALTVRRPDLAAVVFNPALMRTRKPEGPVARVILTDGSRLDLIRPTADEAGLSGQTRFGRPLALPWDSIASVLFLDGPVTYLSDLRPKAEDQTGFLGVTWPWAADRTTAGGELTLDGPGGIPTTCDKGLALRPRTRLTYELGGRYRRFEATIGYTPEGRRAEALVRIRIDGRTHVVESARQREGGRGRPTPVRLDVTHAQQLVLEVDFAPGSDGGAEVVWGHARLIR